MNKEANSRKCWGIWVKGIWNLGVPSLKFSLHQKLFPSKKILISIGKTRNIDTMHKGSNCVPPKGHIQVLNSGICECDHI